MSQTVEPGCAAVRAVPPALTRSVPAASAGRARAVSPTPAAGRLRLTGEAAGLYALQRKLAAAPAVDVARVASVRDALAGGNYRIHADVIAARMLELDQHLRG